MLRKKAHIPVPVNDLVLFIAYLHKNGTSASSIASALSALGHSHKLASVSDNTKHFLVTKALLGARKVSPSSDTRLPITARVLHDLILALPKVVLSLQSAKMFQAMFALAFHGFLRIGEIAPKSHKQEARVIQLSDVNWQSGRSQAVITIRQFKHSTKQGPQNFIIQKAKKREATICPVRLLRRFLKFRSNSPGPLFMLPDRPCLRRQFDNELKASLSFCGYSTAAYKGHSFRIGAASEAAARGVPDAKIRSLGRWSSDAFRRYIRITGMAN